MPDTSHKFGQTPKILAPILVHPLSMPHCGECQSIAIYRNGVRAMFLPTPSLLSIFLTCGYCDVTCTDDTVLTILKANLSEQEWHAVTASAIATERRAPRTSGEDGIAPGWNFYPLSNRYGKVRGGGFHTACADAAKASRAKAAAEEGAAFLAALTSPPPVKRTRK